MGGIAKGIGSVVKAPTNFVGGILGINEGQGDYATPEQIQQGKYRDFANNYDTEMGLADKGVQESALTRDLYGEGGLQSRLSAEEQQLANQGFNLTQEDRTAYGQAAGDITRQFGQQEQDISKSLASRGLAGGSSGAAGAAFSGAAGNKNEMLAQAQTTIAQNRYQDTMNRLQQTRSQMQTMGTQGSQLANQRFSDKGQGLLNAVNVENVGNDQNRTMLSDKEAAYNPGLMGTINQGLQRGVGQVAQQAPGMALGAATGGGSMASSLGGGMSSGSGFGASSYGSSGLASKKGPSLFG